MQKQDILKQSLLVCMLGLSVFAIARDPGVSKCRSSKCGLEFLKEGWKEIARCEGHQWRYLLQKGDQRKLCVGIDALDGPSEDPCVDYRGDVSQFRKCAVGPTGQ